MVDGLASLTPGRSQSRSIQAPLEDVRPVSLPTPNAPLAPDGRSLSASAASSPRDSQPTFHAKEPGLMPSTLMGTGSRMARAEGGYSGSRPASVRSVPSIVIDHTGTRPSSRPGSRPGSRCELERKIQSESPPPVPPIDSPFNGISMDIPTGSLDGLGHTMKFSSRGSLIKDKSKKPHRVQEANPKSEPHLEEESEGQDAESTPAPSISTGPNDAENATPKATPRPVRTQSTLRPRQTILPNRAISADEDMLSRRVRLMYEKGEDNITDSEVANAMTLENSVLWEENAASDSGVPQTLAPESNGTETRQRASSEVERTRMKRETQELAGGIEYWQNVGAGEVDRYGFIHAPAANSPDRTEPNPIQRVTTSLLLASETPRRKRSIRPPSALASNRSFTARSPTRKLSQNSMGARPSSSQSAHSTPLRRSGSRLRSAANHLPHNRDRKFKDEAGDMLTLPFEAVNGEGENHSPSRAMRKKEWEREDKWTKMAKPIKKNNHGGGMTFEFDTKSTKLIERTWKGIPDRWRATAWYSFLETSAKRHPGSPSEEQLIEAFRKYQYISSPDDVQIDIDVPRTITSHIMFRRRYRGGQRLLFRVLHAMSLYFPETGYVQGMAALAATLLAYYDEDHAFIMLARLWQLRGLGELYKSGFAGLMEALADFEREWLAGGEVATKLNEVGVPPTAYGTRWYLTLFNYSIPFPAQLRVWDVFMLLGDAENIMARPTTSSGKNGKEEAPASSFGQGLDVLHATSAALIDGMREIILESDFENIMKVLTSWVPIKDVELFMRVAKAEWKVHRRRRSP
ncbi:hypothetical protein NUU61_004687 [Penicillium alfredii]|uniref:Rab-GAP TBC domain-containing protein n=1 Tax=Penicillium alfredii TaxID=1506179 RepID=A0A9W9F821_9EURO|nr:uncharacterized protein NUU61_004687 [Penicillium alfredii]KAJ5095331.1 hypothetical protein NUU61_004687 [Penicillium alfredii]